MGFELYIPQAPLSDFVICLWSQVGVTPYKREKVLPMGVVDVMFNLGSPHKVINKQDETKFDLHRGAWVSGLHTEYIIIEAVAETRMVGIRFQPGGAHALFGIPMNELSNQVVDLSLLWGGLIEEIRERLAEAPTMQARFQILEQFLLARMQIDWHKLLPIQIAIGTILGGNYSSVRRLSDDIGISQKHLSYRFKELVGVRPKELHRITRFNTLLQSINATYERDWAKIALDCGYYDQSHFNHDFQAFSGLAPTTYLKQRAEWFGETTSSDYDARFVPIE